MKKSFRVIDTGHLTAAENMALDEVILELKERGLIPDTIRFLSFKPHAALVGYFQTVEKEIRKDFCVEEGIDINRRITGGGALYWNPTDVGWEIFTSRDDYFRMANFEAYYRLFCGAVSDGINNFGIKSSFRPRNDIEVGGKKISGSGGTSLNSIIMFQGTLLVDLNIDIMLRCLRVPIEKLNYSEISSLRERVTWLSRELGYCPSRKEIIANIIDGFKKNLGIDVYFGELSGKENKLMQKKINYFKSPEYIYRIREKKSQFYIKSIVKSAKSVIKCAANIDIKRRKLKNLYFTGDFFMYPGRAIYDLESILKNISIDRDCLKELIENFFKNYPEKIYGIGQNEIVRVIGDCFSKIGLKKYGIPLRYFNDIYLVRSEFSDKNKIEALLLPYCAKLPSCKYRYKQGCSLCGQCSIRSAEEIAKKYKVRTYTVVSFEHLMETIRRLKKEGVRYYAGCCCEAFYQKHKQDFESIDLPGILLNIENTTCYDLGKEKDAYRGKFEGFTDIKTDLLEKILKIMT